MKEKIWNDVTKISPPDKEVYVKYNDGTIRKAIPTYYPFNIVGGKIIHTENQWDGNFMVELKSLNDDFIDTEITHWAECEEETMKYNRLPS